MVQLNCFLADAQMASHYRRACLDISDQARLAQSPQLEQRDDWRVSRFLKQQSCEPILSLAHSQGRAAVLSSSHQMVCGVDIEIIKQRDFMALAQWVCTPDEWTFLAQIGWKAQEFYRLWCIKEALIKAEHLSFPADMLYVGYRFEKGLLCGLTGKHGTNWYGISMLWGDEAVLAGVWQGNHVILNVQTYGFDSGLLKASRHFQAA